MARHACMHAPARAAVVRCQRAGPTKKAATAGFLKTPKGARPSHAATAYRSPCKKGHYWKPTCRLSPYTNACATKELRV
jgi:hypothetical protein